jgi:DNA-binding transcriptional LysR family regulator
MQPFHPAIEGLGVFRPHDGGPMSSIELRQLRYFLAVAEERHFGRAAQRLQIAQPGLSHQIKVLERLLGVPLFLRDPRGVELTRSGETLLEQARLLLELADRAVESTRLTPSGKRGILKVGTPAAGIHQFANELLRQFQIRYPEVLLEIHPDYAPNSIEQMTWRTLDAAILLAPFDRHESMRYLTLGAADMLAALPEGHRLAALTKVPQAELLSEPFIDWRRSMNPALYDHLHQSLFGALGHPTRVDIPDVMEISRLLAVAHGKGITVVLFPSVVDLGIQNVVFRAIEPSTALEYGLAWFDTSASRFVPTLVQLARELVDDRMMVDTAS